MTKRTVPALLLFLAGALTTSVVLATTVFIGVRAQLPLGRWTLPAVALLSFVPIFFLGRRSVLPPAYSKPPLRALAIITVWMALTMAAALGLAWVIRPLVAAIGFGPSAVVMWLACVVTTWGVLDRAGGKAGRRAVL